MHSLVSIIIPTFNRAHLIVETLSSIIAQSYKYWECIVIDDRSEDNTQIVLNSICETDNRFIYYIRPESTPKGANTCRNIGLEKAKGDYVVFFDSDDLMESNHLEVKVNSIIKYQCDFIITKTNYFNKPEENANLEQQYHFNSNAISAFNYISHKVNWLTLDVCIDSKIAKSITFNEKLKSGQEYNYFSKLVLQTCNAVFINKVVSLRRYQAASIRGGLRHDKKAIYNSFFNTYWMTYLDIKDQASNNIKHHLIYKCTVLCYKLGKAYKPNSYFYKALVSEMKLKGIFHAVRLYFCLHNKQKVA